MQEPISELNPLTSVILNDLHATLYDHHVDLFIPVCISYQFQHGCRGSTSSILKIFKKYAVLFKYLCTI